MGKDGVMLLADDKALLKAYYAGQQIASPIEGFLIPLGVRAHPDGSATALFECSASSLRYQLPIPKASRSERDKVKAAQDAGEEPDCPRHGHGQRLFRAGSELMCSFCGVSYGKT